MNWGRRCIDALIGALVAVTFLIPTWALLYLQPDEPYKDVRLIQMDKTDTEIHLVATFDKNPECTFVALRVLKESFGVWTEVQWHDLERERGDRLAGPNTLKIGFRRSVPDPDIYQIRTRHMCGDVQTDKVFITVKP